MSLQQLLQSFNACGDAQIWVKDRSIEEAVRDCPRGDWMLWLAKRLNIDERKLFLAKARCAKTVLHLMKDQRSIDAVLMAERYGEGTATKAELTAAAAYAYAAAAYAYAAAAYAAAAAAYAARRGSQSLTAQICRDLIGDAIIAAVRDKLTLNHHTCHHSPRHT